MAKLDMHTVSVEPRYVDFPDEQVATLLEAGYVIPARPAKPGVYTLTTEGWERFAKQLLLDPVVSPEAVDGAHRK